MRIILQLVGAIIMFAGCGVDRQAKALRALEKCQYAFVSADSVYLAGTDVNKLVANGRVDISRLPGVAMGFLSRDIPLSGILNLRITNPTNTLAGIQQFAYKIAVEDREVLEGTSDLPIEVPAGKTVTVPVKLQTNVYPFLSDRQTLQKLLAFIQSARDGATDEKVNLTLSIKPTLALGNKQLNYPGYIDIDKQVDASMLLKAGILPR
ncbi:LEA type 2 family protein [Parapedobacter sp. 10938]|uniref:LEA type 2 family protein n=1 Tax=Parapedobacter flavus TaxID=3110225 RepID=UPI002DBBD26B|nr:LEA type 2 family protein [Parapedobacter sp. 10938]MEC3878023.1 LEA type 2 family protein [Parapedobacter sp. 10938]